MARVDFKLPPGGNNGLAIRAPGTGNAAYEGMCESQVLDDNYEVNKAKLVGKPQPIDAKQAHGSVYGMVAAARGYQHPIGEWNFEEVTVKGSTIKVELNGTVILDADLSKVDMENVMAHSKHPGKDRTSGFFGFAGHNDPGRFRKHLHQSGSIEMTEEYGSYLSAYRRRLTERSVNRLCSRTVCQFTFYARHTHRDHRL